jgi:hypothetical protein
VAEPKRDEIVALRELPPVPPVVWPERLSQTLARYLNRCPYSAYLYVATGGSAPTLEMDRGTLAHAGLALMMAWQLQGRVPAGFDETPGAAGDEALSALTAEIVRQAAEENPRLWLSHEQKDVARLCVFHGAIGLDVKAEHVAGIERKFLLELDCGWTVSGIIDLASMPGDTLGQVDDYKTSLHVPPEQEWDWFQTKLYAAMLMFGRPHVGDEHCARCEGSGEPAADLSGARCPDCRGRGKIEVFGDPIGSHLREVLGRELYPRHDPRKRADGTLAHVCRREGGQPKPWTRLELQELVIDLNDAGDRLSEMLTTWKFPARFGTKACGECPAEELCPIPRGYRRFAGHIRTREEAGEAWAWADRMKSKVAATEKEVKAWADRTAASLTLGETTWEHQISEVTALKKARGRADWDGFRSALELAEAAGEPIAPVLEEYIRVSNRSEFKKVKKGAGAGDERGVPGAAASGEGQGAAGAGGVGAGGSGDARAGGDQAAGARDIEAERDEKYGDTLPE